MKPITFTSEQLLDIIDLLEEKENAFFDANDKELGSYYMGMGVQLRRMYDRLQNLPIEERIVELVISSTEQK